MMPDLKTYSPTRVIVDDGGLGETAERALSVHGIEPEVIFYRNDGWSLGAPSRFESVAYTMWKGSWTHFAYINSPDADWIPINQY